MTDCLARMRETGDMPSYEDDPVIQRLIFGELARQYREELAIDFPTAEAELASYQGKLSKIENGMIAADRALVEGMIALYELAGEDADHMRDLAMSARRRSTPAKVPGNSRRYVALERVASEIRMVYNEIPGLLQNAEFACAILSRSPFVPSAEARPQAEAREQRSRAIIRPGGPNIWIVLGIEALYREVGGREILREQLMHLAKVAEFANVRFRVLPWSAGSSPALGCPFTLLYIKPSRTIAYVASLTRPEYIKATGPYTVAFDQAWELAVSDSDSAEILGERIAALS